MLCISPLKSDEDENDSTLRLSDDKVWLPSWGSGPPQRVARYKRSPDKIVNKCCIQSVNLFIYFLLFYSVCFSLYNCISCNKWNSLSFLNYSFLLIHHLLFYSSFPRFFIFNQTAFRLARGSTIPRMHLAEERLTCCYSVAPSGGSKAAADFPFFPSCWSSLSTNDQVCHLTLQQHETVTLPNCHQ